MARQLEELRLLVVDDQMAARSLAAKMLKNLGVSQVYEAPDGRAAMKFLDSAGDMIDLILCDWNMPGMSGVELLKQVRSTGFDIPFLMLTGRADLDSVMEAKSAGVTSYIAKPYSQAQLEAKIRIAMSKAGAKNAAAS